MHPNFKPMIVWTHDLWIINRTPGLVYSRQSTKQNSKAAYLVRISIVYVQVYSDI